MATTEVIKETVSNGSPSMKSSDNEKEKPMKASNTFKPSSSTPRPQKLGVKKK